MLKRAISTLVLWVALIVLLRYFGRPAAVLFTTLLAVLTQHELYGMLARMGHRPFHRLGLLIGVSFLATPVKFRAASLDLPVALDVGRVTFELFSKVELGFCAALLIAGALLLDALGVQQSWLRPAEHYTRWTVYSDQDWGLLLLAVLAMVVLGGMGHIPGVILGAVLLSILPEVLRYGVGPLQMALFGKMLIDPESLRMLIFGLALVLAPRLLRRRQA